MPDAASPLSVEKQYEFMYQDMVGTIAERKRTLFDLSRWIVTVQSAIIAFPMLQSVDMPAAYIVLPVLVGVMGFVLNAGISTELNSHRKALAQMRINVGGDFEEIHREMVDVFARNRPRNRSDYWKTIAYSHSLIIVASSIVGLAATSYFIG